MPPRINPEMLQRALSAALRSMSETGQERASFHVPEAPVASKVLINPGNTTGERYIALASKTPMVDVDLNTPWDVHNIRTLSENSPSRYEYLQSVGHYPELGDALDRIDQWKKDSGRSLQTKLTPGGLHVDDLTPGSQMAFDYNRGLPSQVQQMADTSYMRMAQRDPDQLFNRRLSRKINRGYDFIEAPLEPITAGNQGIDPKKFEMSGIQDEIRDIVNRGKRDDPREAMSWAASQVDPKRAALLRAMYALSAGGLGVALSDGDDHKSGESRAS